MSERSYVMLENASATHLNHKLADLHKRLMDMATLLRIKLPLSLTIVLRSPSGLSHNMGIITTLARIVQEALQTQTMPGLGKVKTTRQLAFIVDRLESSAYGTPLKLDPNR